MSGAAWVARDPAARWHPTPSLQASIGVHGLAVLGALAAPAAWPWLLGAIAANHVVLSVAGLLPRSTLLGPNLTRLPTSTAERSTRRDVALTIDDGPDPEVTPRVLDLLDADGIKATFFCIGRRAKQRPDLCRLIVARGHGVENHGYSHSAAFSLFGPQAMRRDIQRAQDTLADITGVAPRYFRPKPGLRNPMLDPVLHDLGLHLAAWTHRGFDTREGNADVVLNRLTRRLGPGDILLLHDGNAALTADGSPVILAVLPRLIAHLSTHRLMPVLLPDSHPVAQ